MSFRLVNTPLAAPMPVPAPRNDAIAEAVASAIVPAPGTDLLLQQLREPGTLTVTTGQQPALLLGPLYTLHKALSAAALAALLAERWQRRVVPVFWVAGDDHDWDEARTAWWLDADGELLAAALPERPVDAPMLPLSQMPLGDAVRSALELFRASQPTGPEAGRTLELLDAAYVPDATMGQAATTALAHVLAPMGVLVLDSTREPFKRAALPLLISALQDAPALTAALLDREADLRQQGSDPGIGHQSGETLVMLNGPAGRDRLLHDGSGYRLRRAGHSYSMKALERLAEEEPGQFSANVLLRPVIESKLLASVAYCAGPGELRYLRLAKVVFDTLRVSQPAAVPRWSGLIVDSYVDRMLRKFGLTIDELTDPRLDVLGRSVRERLPATAVDAFSRLRAAAADALGTLARDAAELDPTLVRSAQGAERRVEFEAGRLERRFIRNLKHRHATELRQLTRARTSVLPADRPQERVLSAAGPLTRYGRPLLDAVQGAAASLYESALEGPPVPA